MNVEHLDLADSHTIDFRSQANNGIPATREVLEEVFHLLEDYAPTWYTEQQHNRIIAALVGRTD